VKSDLLLQLSELDGYTLAKFWNKSYLFTSNTFRLKAMRGFLSSLKDSFFCLRVRVSILTVHFLNKGFALDGVLIY
jgi:hypothetical protein